VIARLRRLEAGGIRNVLLADPGATPASLRAFAQHVMPAFAVPAVQAAE